MEQSIFFLILFLQVNDYILSNKADLLLHYILVQYYNSRKALLSIITNKGYSYLTFQGILGQKNPTTKGFNNYLTE
jgi:hypothetical protein